LTRLLLPHTTGGVAKVMPPLLIDDVALKEGLEILAAAVEHVAEHEVDREAPEVQG
jgi:4-aminobutyrate aminotransferase-like enzyme